MGISYTAGRLQGTTGAGDNTRVRISERGVENDGYTVGPDITPEGGE